MFYYPVKINNIDSNEPVPVITSNTDTSSDDENWFVMFAFKCKSATTKVKINNNPSDVLVYLGSSINFIDKNHAQEFETSASTAKIEHQNLSVTSTKSTETKKNF